MNFNTPKTENTVKKIEYKDFDNLGMLGSGAYGKVLKVRPRKNLMGLEDKEYAMKVISKELVIKNNMK